MSVLNRKRVPVRLVYHVFRGFERAKKVSGTPKSIFQSENRARPTYKKSIFSILVGRLMFENLRIPVGGICLDSFI